MTFEQPTVAAPDELLFGCAPHPVRAGLDLEIGAGRVYPEINFTLPPMTIDAATWPHVREIYDETVRNLLARARRLGLEGLVVEFEHPAARAGGVVRPNSRP